MINSSAAESGRLLIPRDESNLLELYLDNEVFNTEFVRNSPHWCYFFCKIVFALFGAAWGLPWKDASYAAAGIFHEDSEKEIFGNLFGYGIILTVGLDGLWIMLEATDRYLKSSSDREKRLTSDNDKIAFKILSFVFGLLSSTSSVYASFKYSVGVARFYSIITLVGSMGGGYLGYTKFISKIHEFFSELGMSDENKELLKFKKDVIRKINKEIENKSNLNGIKNTSQLIHHLNGIGFPEDNNKCKKYSKEYVPLLFALSVPVSAALVAVYLAQEAIYTKIWSNNAFAYIIAILAEVASFSISLFSTYQVFSQIYERLTCEKSQQHHLAIMAVGFLVSLLAPSAACYIVYKTLSNANVDHDLTLTSTVAIGIARLIFSYFTTTVLLQKSINYLEKKCANVSTAESRVDLPNLSYILSKTNLGYFSALKKYTNSNVVTELMQTSDTSSVRSDAPAMGMSQSV